MTDEELIARLHLPWPIDGNVEEVTLPVWVLELTGEAADRIEALTEQLAAARQDAKAAEDELEMQEQEACMMENDYIKLEKERDALEAKLAKTVEALRQIADPISLAQGNVNAEIALATLAEIKGESHD